MTAQGERPEWVPCAMKSGKPLEIAPCEGLASLNTGRFRGLGISTQARASMSRMEVTRILWVIRSGQHARNGMVMNFCPCCGASLEALTEGMFEPASPPAPTPATEVGHG